MRYIIILALLVLALCAWSPWITPQEADQMINARILALQEKNPELCPIQVLNNTIVKVPFGFREKLTYDCSEVDDVYGVAKSQNIVFVTFYKDIIGMPEKFVKE